MKGKFPGALATWGEVPGEQRDLWFNEFKRYYYWWPHQHRAMRRNFELKGAKQLRSFYAYARKSGKAPHVSPENWAKLQKYWEGEYFQRLSTQNKKNRASDAEGLSPALHTCGATPITERRRQLVTIYTLNTLLFNTLINSDTTYSQSVQTASLQREPTLDELYKETHTSKKKDKAGSWVSKKAELKLKEHRKRREEYRHSRITSPSTSVNPGRDETDMWLEANVNQKGDVYGFGAHGAWMKERARWSTSSRSTSVKNYDAVKWQ